MRYALNQWGALTRFLEDGEWEIDNGATERANRDIALGRGNWTFFGSDSGGKTAAVLRSFIASCKRSGVEPFAWFRDVLSRIPAHSITRLGELLPHNWKRLNSPRQSKLRIARVEDRQERGSRAAYDFLDFWLLTSISRRDIKGETLG